MDGAAAVRPLLGPGEALSAAAALSGDQLLQPGGLLRPPQLLHCLPLAGHGQQFW